MESLDKSRFEENLRQFAAQEAWFVFAFGVLLLVLALWLVIEGLLSLWLAGSRGEGDEDPPTLFPLSDLSDSPTGRVRPSALPLRPLTPPAGGVTRPEGSMR